MYGILTMKFEEIYPKYDSFIEHCLTKVKDLSDIEDIKQNILIRIYQGHNSIKYPETIRSWLSSCIRNYLTDYFRKRRFNCISFSEIEVDSEIYECFEPENILIEEKDPSVILENKELKNNIQETLDKIGDPWRRMIIARDIKDLRYKDIARKYAIKLGTVKSRIARARERFIKVFSEEPNNGK